MQMEIEPNAATARYTYHWFTVWTAVSGEDITIQYKTINGAHTARADQLELFAMDLDDGLAEDIDWKYVEDATPVSLTTSFASRASSSITPATAGDDWLVMGTGTHTGVTEPSRSVDIKLFRSGEASSDQPEFIEEAGDTVNDALQHTMFRVYNLGSASNTFTIQSASVGGNSGTYQSSAIFLMNLDRFKQDYEQYTEAQIDLSNTAYATEVQTLSLSLSCPNDVWTMGSFAFDGNSAGLY